MYMTLLVHRGLLLADSSFLEMLGSQDMLRKMSDRKKGQPSQRVQTKVSCIHYRYGLTFRPIVGMLFTDALDVVKQRSL
jgi:hypothetical protein